jgi:hypothetical protein
LTIATTPFLGKVRAKTLMWYMEQLASLNIIQRSLRLILFSLKILSGQRIHN